jgi:hypothetical protein
MYPTASAPQYAFGPGLAPVPMPGMARGGLAALANQYRKGGKIRYFEDGGDSSATGGADSSAEGGAGAAMGGGSDPGPGPGSSDPGVGGGGGSDPGAAAQAAAQGVDNAVAAAQDAEQNAAAEATLGAQVAAEAEEAEATKAAENMANLQAQADAVAAEIAANQEEDAKNEAMAQAFANSQAPAAPSFGVSFQNPFALDKPLFGVFDPAVSVQTPMGVYGISPMDVAAPAMGRAAQAVNTGVNMGRTMGFAEGGVASLANQVQSKGRGQDTMLVHMTPGEVKGLQALAMSQGGSLTINPQTGLPEAGFLSSILPMIAGFALGPAGFALMSAPMAGLTVGAMTGIATGSLKKGLMAGLGAYGGAGIGEGLVGAANATTPVTTGAEAGLTSASEMAASNLSPEALNANMLTPEAITQSGINSPYYKMAQSNIDPGLLEGMGGTPGMTAQQVATAPVINPTPSIPTSPTTGFESAGTGFKNMFDTGQVGTDARSAFMKATPTGSLTAAGTTVASALTPEPAPLQTSKSFIRGYDLDITNPSGTPMYTPQDTREREQVRYAFSPRPIYEAAQGGLTALNGQTYDDEYGRDEYAPGGSVKKRKVTSLRGNPYYKFAQDRKDSSMEAAVEQNFAKGGLGAVLPPRFLSGGGDGMSDSIKARIGGVQEARLADGEFVVPADVVSHLGNGSSKAGAKKLYAMMDKIRKARTGRTRQAPEVNARKYMPA